MASENVRFPGAHDSSSHVQLSHKSVISLKVNPCLRRIDELQCFTHEMRKRMVVTVFILFAIKKNYIFA